MPIIACVTIDRRYSGEALTELSAKFPKHDRLSSDKDPRLRYLTFSIEDAQCLAFLQAHRGLGAHRGELMFFRPLAVPQTASS